MYLERVVSKPDRRPWTKQEKDAVREQFSTFIATGQVPGKRYCDEAIQKDRRLAKRSWKHIKYCVKNIISTSKSKRC